MPEFLNNPSVDPWERGAQAARALEAPWEDDDLLADDTETDPYVERMRQWGYEHE